MNNEYNIHRFVRIMRTIQAIIAFIILVIGCCGVCWDDSISTTLRIWVIIYLFPMACLFIHYIDLLTYE